MSCFPEVTYTFYVDGELPPDQLRPVELHLVECRHCRELVVALREEADLVADVLNERVPALHIPSPTASPAQGLALGFGPALVVAALASVAFGWVLETVRPASLDWVGPLSLRGAYDMAFDLVFLLRDKAPAAFEVALAVAAMASISALLTFALTGVLRRWSGPTLLALLALLAVVLPAAPGGAHFGLHEHGLHEHDDYTLPAGEVHEGTLIASARNVSVDGEVKGDLVVLAEQLTVRGKVEGNVIAAARNLELPGEVTGSVHVVVARGNVSGDIAGNLYAGGEHFTLGSSAQIGRDAIVGGENLVFEGSVGRDLIAGGDWVEVRGRVGRNVQAWVERLSFPDGAEISGDVDAMIPRDKQVEVASGARIAGEIRSRHEPMDEPHGFARFLEPGFYLGLALHVGAGFALGMVLHFLVPGLFGARIESAGGFFSALLTGFVAALAIPVALALVGLTVVGIPLAVLGLGVFATALYTSLILVSAWVGSAVIQPSGERWTSFGRSLLVGLVITVVVTQTPFLGPVALAIVILTGLGLVVDWARRTWAASRSAPA